MSHSDIIIITVTLFISSTLGVYATIRVINQHTRPPVNSLERPRGIELDYIEPAQPHQVYNYQNLLESQNPINERITNYISYYERVPSYYTGQPAPSYYSGGNPPSFSTVDRQFINCPLEDYINLDYILISFILGVLFFFLVNYCLLKFSNSNSQMIFTKGISTEVITFRNNYHEILSSKLNKDDRGFFLNYGEIQNIILTHD